MVVSFGHHFYCLFRTIVTSSRVSSQHNPEVHDLYWSKHARNSFLFFKDPCLICFTLFNMPSILYFNTLLLFAILYQDLLLNCCCWIAQFFHAVVLYSVFYLFVIWAAIFFHIHTIVWHVFKVYNHAYLQWSPPSCLWLCLSTCNLFVVREQVVPHVTVKQVHLLSVSVSCVTLLILPWLRT